MPRDYVARNRKPAPSPASLPGWVWLAAGLSMGLAIAALVYIGRPAESMPMVQTVTRPPVAPPRPKIVIEPAKESEFSFYDLLKEQKVDVPRDEPAVRPSNAPLVKPMPEPRPVIPAEKTTPSAAVVAPASPPAAAYVIVLGSFREFANAEEHRASLALNGVEARVAKILRSDGQTLYQVRVGPEKTEARAKSRLAQLKSSGFEGRVVPLN